MKKIAFVGAPRSGKTTLSQRLCAQLLEDGNDGTHLVNEYAKEWLGMKKPLETIFDQRAISEEQFRREEYAESCGFNIILCDSAVWLGQVYANWRIEKFGKHEDERDLPNFNKIMLEYTNWVNSQMYDMTIYVPLFSKDSGVNQFRIHNPVQSEEIDKLLQINLSCIKNVINAPKSLKNRNSFVKYIAEQIAEK